MAKKLLETHFYKSYAVPKSSWLVDIVLNLIEMPVATKDFDFYLEESVATIFDELMPIKGDVTSNNGLSAENYEIISHYQEYNGDLELFSRVYACDMLLNMKYNPDERAFVREVRQRLFKPWTENYPGMPVYTAWKKVTKTYFGKRRAWACVNNVIGIGTTNISPYGILRRIRGCSRISG